MFNPHPISPPLHSLLLLLLFSILITTTALTLPLNLTHPSLFNFSPNLTVPKTNLIPFRITIATAVRSIQSLHPHAQLTRLECTSPRGATHSPTSLSDVRLFFRNQPRTILLASLPSATIYDIRWAAPQYMSDERPDSETGLGDVLTSDILQVTRLMREAGHDGAFDAVDVLRETGMTEVWWCFQMRAERGGRGEGWVWVGDESGRVDFEDDE